MSQSSNGITKICGNDYPFCYEQETEKITIYLGSGVVEIPEGMDQIVGTKLGMITGGNTLYKLSVPLSNDCMTVVDNQTKYISVGSQIRSVEYAIEDYQENSRYAEMRLQFPELDFFIPSTGRAAVSTDEIILSRVKDSLHNFDIEYRDTVVSVSFNTKISAIAKVKLTAETISEVTLKFNETDKIEYLIGLYIFARNFFAFICNRQNIGLRYAVIIGNHPSKTIESGKVVDTVSYTKQRLILSQKYLEPLEDKEQIAKVPNSRIFSNRLEELFQLFFEKRVRDTAIVNGSCIHPSVKYRNLIDLEQSLHITATFEYYVRTMLPEISSQETIDFFNDIQALVDDYIKNVTGKKKKKAKDFMKSLRPQVSLNEKVIKVFDGYSTWQPLKPILTEWFGDDVTDLASAANLWRNELAHEKREYQPDINVIKAIRLIEHINYCIVLRCAGYPDEQIKQIVMDTLAR